MNRQGFASYVTQMKQVGPTSLGQERLQAALQRERSATSVRASEHVVTHRRKVLPSAGVVARPRCSQSLRLRRSCSIPAW